MNINRENYEIWFLDYFEGRLSQKQVKELIAFLELHYDLKKEFDEFENVSLPPEKNIIFNAKESLKKNVIVPVGTINEKNYEEFFIAEIENELTKEKKDQLSFFVEKNPHLKKELELFHKTKIAPDNSIKFPAKETLKKNVIIPVGGVNEKNYAEYFIAAIENDLSLDQLTDLKEFLNKNPQLHKEYKLFGHTKLVVDTAIAFNSKENLKKRVVPIKSFNLKNIYYPVSVAASIILLIAIYFLLRNDRINTVNIAERNGINIHRNVHKSMEQPVKADNPNNIKKYYSNNAQVNKPDFKNVSEYKDFQYASTLNPKNIPINSSEKNIEISKITAYEDFYAMMLKKRNNIEEPKQNDSKYISLKDFALFKLKKSIAPKDKKDKISPADNNISPWDIADAGINKLNKLTGANLHLEHKKDNSGFDFALGNKFEVSRSKTPEK